MTDSQRDEYNQYRKEYNSYFTNYELYRRECIDSGHPDPGPPIAPVYTCFEDFCARAGSKNDDYSVLGRVPQSEDYNNYPKRHRHRSPPAEEICDRRLRKSPSPIRHRHVSSDMVFVGGTFNGFLLVVPTPPLYRRVLADTLAHFISIGGTQAGAEIAKREKDNPFFDFLMIKLKLEDLEIYSNGRVQQNGSVEEVEAADEHKKKLKEVIETHIYFRWRIYSIINGDTFTKWRQEPFKMVSNEDGYIWIPPPQIPTASELISGSVLIKKECNSYEKSFLANQKETEKLLAYIHSLIKKVLKGEELQEDLYISPYFLFYQFISGCERTLTVEVGERKITNKFVSEGSADYLATLLTDKSSAQELFTVLQSIDAKEWRMRLSTWSAVLKICLKEIKDRALRYHRWEEKENTASGDDISRMTALSQMLLKETSLAADVLSNLFIFLRASDELGERNSRLDYERFVDRILSHGLASNESIKHLLCFAIDASAAAHHVMAIVLDEVITLTHVPSSLLDALRDSENTDIQARVFAVHTYGILRILFLINDILFNASHSTEIPAQYMRPAVSMLKEWPSVEKLERSIQNGSLLTSSRVISAVDLVLPFIVNAIVFYVETITKFANQQSDSISKERPKPSLLSLDFDNSIDQATIVPKVDIEDRISDTLLTAQVPICGSEICAEGELNALSAVSGVLLLPWLRAFINSWARAGAISSRRAAGLKEKYKFL